MNNIEQRNGVASLKPEKQNKAYTIIKNILNHSNWLPVKQCLSSHSILTSDEVVRYLETDIDEIKLDGDSNHLSNKDHIDIQNDKRMIKIASTHPKWYWYQPSFLSDIHLINYPKALKLQRFINYQYHNDCKTMQKYINLCLNSKQKKTIQNALKTNPKLLNALGLL